LELVTVRETGPSHKAAMSIEVSRIRTRQRLRSPAVASDGPAVRWNGSQQIEWNVPADWLGFQQFDWDRTTNQDFGRLAFRQTAYNPRSVKLT
jgi:hypothetical protein